MFTQPCFIRKNTKELIKELEELGYSKNSPSWTDKCSIIWCYQYSNEKGFNIPYYVIANAFDIPFDKDSSLCGKFVDCGTNEELFLAIAALRNDTDKNQWFIIDAEIYSDLPKDSWFKATNITGKYHVGSKIDPIYCHKASVQELIEHFKDK